MYKIRYNKNDNVLKLYIIIAVKSNLYTASIKSQLESEL